jgi:hypothetical protein
MFESRQAFGVGGHFGGQHLEGDVTTEAAIPRPIHHTHAARAERRDDVVATESRAYRKGHRQNLLHAAGFRDAFANFRDPDDMVTLRADPAGPRPRMAEICARLPSQEEQRLIRAV